MTRYVAPKTIINHPGVLECLSAVAGGCDEAEYKHDIFLKEGWSFRYGRNAGRRGLHCKTVADFLAAEPTPDPKEGPKLLTAILNGRI